MKEAQIGSGLPVPAFNVPETHEYYWLLRDCYENVVTVSAARTADIRLQQPHSTDIGYINAIGGNLSAISGKLSPFGTLVGNTSHLSSISDALTDVINLLSVINGTLSSISGPVTGIVDTLSVTDNSNPLDPVVISITQAIKDIEAKLQGLVDEMQTPPSQQDIETLTTEYTSAMERWETWVDDMLQQGVSDVLEVLPDVLPLITAILSSGGSAIPVIGHFVIDIIMRATMKYVDARTDEEGLIESNKKILDLIRDLWAVLDGEGNVVGSRIEGLSELSIKINNVLSQGEHDALFSANS